jgi:hypothetical protein
MHDTTDSQSLPSDGLDRLFPALSEHLADDGVKFELVVIGGSALVAMDLIDRSTRDVDVLALMTRGALVTAEPLPAPVSAAAQRVARDFGLPDDWLNAGPASMLDLGLPSGFTDRLTAAAFGPSLKIHYAGRFDQIHFKLYAMVDQGAGRHEADLRALAPNRDEISSAARWARTHDSSIPFRIELLAVLDHLGFSDVMVD